MTGSQSPHYSIIIPAYNEGERIGDTLDRILRYSDSRAWKVEVLVVNDGSRDNTVEIARHYANHNPCLRIIENPGNRGKGFSVRNGMLHAQGKILLFTDADLSSPIQEADKLFAAIQGGAPTLPSARGGSILNYRAGGSHCTDSFLGEPSTSCCLFWGFALKTRSADSRRLQARQHKKFFPYKISSVGVLTRRFCISRKRFHFRVDEIPVLWSDREGTQIHPLRDGIRMLGEVMRVRWNSVCGSM